MSFLTCERKEEIRKWDIEAFRRTLETEVAMRKRLINSFYGKVKCPRVELDYELKRDAYNTNIQRIRKMLKERKELDAMDLRENVLTLRMKMDSQEKNTGYAHDYGELFSSTRGTFAGRCGYGYSEDMGGF